MPHCHHQKPNGFNMAEVLITTAVIGVVTVGFIAPQLLKLNGQDQAQKNLAATQQNITDAFASLASTQGLIPREIAPNRIIIQKLNLNIAPITVPNSHSALNPVGVDSNTITYPAQLITLPNRNKVLVSNAWTETDNRKDYTTIYIEDKDGNALYTSIYRNGEVNNTATLATTNTLGTQNYSATNKTDTTSITTTGESIPLIPKDTEAIHFSLLTRRLSDANIASDWLKILDYSSWQDTQRDVFKDYLYASIEPLKTSVEDSKSTLATTITNLADDLKLSSKERKNLEACNDGLTKSCQSNISSLVNKFQKLKPPDTASINKLNAFRSGTTNADGTITASILQDYDNLSKNYAQEKAVIDAKLKKLSAVKNGAKTNILFIDQNVNVLNNIPYASFINNAVFSFGNLPTMDLNTFIAEFKKTPAYTTMNATLKKDYLSKGGWSAMTAILTTVVDNKDFGLKVSYTDPGTGQPYVMDTSLTFMSPLKVSLKHKPALIDSTNEFLFDNDGANQYKHPVIKTYGGLGTDEAWLAFDRNHNGFYIDGDILDGEDIFGDHMGKYASGYEDLAETFKSYIRIDAKGQQYIELKEPNWFESTWMYLQRLMGQNKAANPSYDLKLLTRDQQIMDASHVFQKIYVDYWNVNEIDADFTNWIRQRSYVQHTDGKYEQSADQWFSPKITFSIGH